MNQIVLSHLPSPDDGEPVSHAYRRETQPFGQLRTLPLGLREGPRREIASRLNKILADTRVLHDLYKKTHWLMRGPTFYQLHLLMDEHAGQQYALIDALAERVQTLGAIAVGDPRHVAELTSVPRPPDGAEEVPAMLGRLLETHELILGDVRDAAHRAAELGDDGSNDLLVSDVLRTNELQVWFVFEHLSGTPLVPATK